MTIKAEIVPQGTWAVAQQERNERQLDAMSIEELVGQVALIQHAMKAVMKEGTHFGRIPGVDKPSLYKPGTELLTMLFRLDAQFESVETWDGKHLTVKSRCTLYHSPSGRRLGSGEGSCSTKESRYAYRMAQRTCPNCKVEAIIKGKEEYGGGWLCFKKKNGCGAKFHESDHRIESQQVGRVDNEDIADQYNTVLKMANKRSHAAATLVVTAASDCFTQDVEDLPQFEREPVPARPEQHVKRFTPEEMEAARAKPQPPRKEEPKPITAPEAGFDAAIDGADVQKYGAPAGQKQIKAFWASVDARAKELGIPKRKEDVGRKLLAHYGIEHSSDIGMDIFDELIFMVAKFQLADLEVAA